MEITRQYQSIAEGIEVTASVAVTPLPDAMKPVGPSRSSQVSPSAMAAMCFAGVFALPQAVVQPEVPQAFAPVAAPAPQRSQALQQFVAYVPALAQFPFPASAPAVTIPDRAMPPERSRAKDQATAYVPALAQFPFPAGSPAAVYPDRAMPPERSRARDQAVAFIPALETYLNPASLNWRGSWADRSLGSPIASAAAQPWWAWSTFTPAGAVTVLADSWTPRYPERGVAVLRGREDLFAYVPSIATFPVPLLAPAAFFPHRGVPEASHAAVPTFWSGQALAQFPVPPLAPAAFFPDRASASSATALANHQGFAWGVLTPPSGIVPPKDSWTPLYPDQAPRLPILRGDAWWVGPQALAQFPVPPLSWAFTGPDRQSAPSTVALAQHQATAFVVPLLQLAVPGRAQGYYPEKAPPSSIAGPALHLVLAWQPLTPGTPTVPPMDSWAGRWPDRGLPVAFARAEAWVGPQALAQFIPPAVGWKGWTPDRGLAEPSRAGHQGFAFISVVAPVVTPLSWEPIYPDRGVLVPLPAAAKFFGGFTVGALPNYPVPGRAQGYYPERQSRPSIAHPSLHQTLAWYPSVSIPMVLDPDRFLVVLADGRVFTVPAEGRLVAVPAQVEVVSFNESRTIVVWDGRLIAVPRGKDGA
jgi:hypothetical protein